MNPRKREPSKGERGDSCQRSTHPEPNASTDLLILSDGTVYARNLTPELAAVLATLNPHDATLARRASATFPLP